MCRTEIGVPKCARSYISQFRHLPNFQLRLAHVHHAHAPYAYVHVLASKLRGTPLRVMYTATHVHFLQKIVKLNLD